jgi:NADH-quinone oxidoreductase subunit L
VADYLWLIPALPLAASALIAFFGPRFIRNLSHWPCILGIAGSCVLSVLVLLAVIQSPDEHPKGVHCYYTWFEAGDVDVGLSLRADALTAIMLVTVTFISTLIAIYSSGYMRGDAGYPRYFAEIALFVFAMTGLVLADNFIVLYAFWEGVGLCSYLLIGFWFQKPAAAAAARKAFLVTRIGDTGFILGIILLWLEFGFHLGYDDVFDRAANVSESWLTIICLLLFCGAVGKSAQFPLHVWLPDAMEGPSPVSALIHAATMVTAGVYMVARCMPLFERVPSVLLLVAFIGAFTALLAALIALTQNDLKRVLAYSTISQLGYMFLALGSGVKGLATVAVVAAVFHLFTHAFFKALLFLSAGSVMHAMGNVIDMRRFSGLRTILPVTHWTFLFGALALAGFPLASGFWSKDEILGAAFEAGHKSTLYSTAYYAFFVMGLVTAGLTAFYTFRGYFRTFWGELRVPEEAGHHAHESPSVMTIPLIILAVAALLIGIIVGPMTHWFSGLVARTPRLGDLLGHHPNYAMMAISSVVAVGGMLLAYWMYVRQPELPGKLVRHSRELYQLSLNKFRFDEFYNLLIVQPLAGAARICRVIDQYLVDGLVDLLGNLPRVFGHLFRPMQNGLVQFYALAMVFGLIVFLVTMTRILTANP